MARDYPASRWQIARPSATWRPSMARRWDSFRSTPRRSTISASPDATRRTCSSSKRTPRRRESSARMTLRTLSSATRWSSTSTQWNRVSPVPSVHRTECPSSCRRRCSRTRSPPISSAREQSLRLQPRNRQWRLRHHRSFPRP